MDKGTTICKSGGDGFVPKEFLFIFLLDQKLFSWPIRRQAIFSDHLLNNFFFSKPLQLQELQIIFFSACIESIYLFYLFYFIFCKPLQLQELQSIFYIDGVTFPVCWGWDWLLLLTGHTSTICACIFFKGCWPWCML